MSINNIFIQARLNSRRLKNKLMLMINNKPLIYWVYYRVKKTSNFNKLIFVIPDTPENDPLYNYLQALDVEIFRGSEKNLIKRFYDAVKLFPCDNVIRVCADNPFICHKEIDKLINFFCDNECDLAFNNIPHKNNYPDGLGAEICKSKLISQLNEKNLNNDEKEHIFNYVKNNKTKYTIKTFDPDDEIACSNLKLDIDTIKDYNKISKHKVDIDMDGKMIVEEFR